MGGAPRDRGRGGGGGGRATREAAARLYLSPKTVEYHLRNVHGKLGIRSREELQAAMAGERPTRVM